MSLSFKTLKLVTPLNERTLKTLDHLGFVAPTPVQATCIPLMLSRKDVVAEAVTGSGKTLAFLIPVVEILLNRAEKLRKCDVGALILTPTRELAQQIYKVVLSFTQSTALTQVLFTGGKSIHENMRNFQEDGGNIVVATPGKLFALFQQKGDVCLKDCVKALEVLIIDEADRLLSQATFEKDLREIFHFLPKQRRTSLFSATQTDKVEEFVKSGLRNPVQIVVRKKKKEISRTPDTLENFYFTCEAKDKLKNLVAFLRLHRSSKNIVFFNTCASVDYFCKLLTIVLKNIPVVSIHGNMKKKRNAVFEKFHGMDSGVLMCTDVMARGIDFPMVDWVVQFDPPSNIKAFVHRCGRTARMGKCGKAILFLLPNETSYVDFVRINQQCYLSEFENMSLDAPSIFQKTRKLLMKDRELYEKSLRAFVSFIQCYHKHECNIIFQFNELDICGLAQAFGLLHLPKMPELKQSVLVQYDKVDINVNDICYKDKVREKVRQQKLLERETMLKEKVPHQKSVKWSMKKGRMEKKKTRKEKKDRKRKLVEENDDAYELLKEGRLVKKLKNRKITAREFNSRVSDDVEESD